MYNVVVEKPISLVHHLSRVWQKSPSRIKRALVIGALVWYLALGFRTELVLLGRLPVVPMQDFRVYMDAYTRAAQGADPYVLTETAEPFLYPLPSLLLIAPFSLVQSEYLRAAAFITINCVLLICILRMIARRYHYGMRQVWWWFPLAFGFAPLLELLQLGQINLVTSFGIVLIFLYADSIPFLSGFGLTLAAVTKLSPIAFVAYLLSARRWSAIAWGILLTGAAFVVALLAFGWSSQNSYPMVINALFSRVVGESDSQTLVAVLHSLGWIESGAQAQLQILLTVFAAVVILTSGIIGYLSAEQEPFFLVLALGTTIAANRLWYHHYVFVLIPILIWIAWSRFNPAVVLWAFAGLTMTQVDRGFWTHGLATHVFVHLSILAILGWQISVLWQVQRQTARWVTAGFSLGLLLIAFGPLRTAWDVNSNLTAARLWIAQNLPAGRRLALDSFAPDVNLNIYAVQEVQDISAHPPEWYIENGFEYIVFGYESKGSFCTDPRSDARLPERYAPFLYQFAQVTRFGSCLSDIRILETGADGLASHRVGARLGSQGEWLEFVGYDQISTQDYVFYWRSLQSRRMPLTLTARLLDNKDHEIARSSGNLFGSTSSDGRWPVGIVTVPWTTSIPAGTLPGAYRLALQVNAGEGIGDLSVSTMDRQPVSDKLFIGPLRIPPLAPSQAELGDAHPIRVTFADTFSLVGYYLDETEASPGESVSISLFWRSNKASNKNYTVFLHLLDKSGRVVSQVDAQPHAGTFPTSLWESGQRIRDDHVLYVPPNLPPGEYRIELGLYEYPSMTRLRAVGADGKSLGNRILLDDVIRVANNP